MRTELQGKRDAQAHVKMSVREDTGRLRVSLRCPKGTRTKQEFKKECDVNNIVKRYGIDRLRAHAEAFGAKYGVMSNDQYQHSLMVIREAETLFNELPSKLRQKFGGDPGKFIEFMENDENRQEAKELGIFFPEDSEASSEAGGRPETAVETPEGSSPQEAREADSEPPDGGEPTTST